MARRGLCQGLFLSSGVCGDVGRASERMLATVELGLNHEQQHQELLLMDIKHVFSVNPLRPVYRFGTAALSGPATEPLRWVSVDPAAIVDTPVAVIFAVDRGVVLIVGSKRLQQQAALRDDGILQGCGVKVGLAARGAERTPIPRPVRQRQRATLGDTLFEVGEPGHDLLDVRADAGVVRLERRPIRLRGILSPASEHERTQPRHDRDLAQ